MRYLKVSKYYNHQNKLFVDILSIDAEEVEKKDALGMPYLRLNNILWHVQLGSGIPLGNTDGVLLTQFIEPMHKDRPSSCMFNLSKMNEFRVYSRQAISTLFEFESE
jgi:hypothetical protein